MALQVSGCVMVTTDVQKPAHDLEAAGADPRLAAAIAQAIRASSPPVPRTPTRPVPVIVAVLVAAIGIGGAGIYSNGDRIDTLTDRVAGLEVSLSDRISKLEVSVSERFARIETLLEERLPERQ